MSCRGSNSNRPQPRLRWNCSLVRNAVKTSAIVLSATQNTQSRSFPGIIQEPPQRTKHLVQRCPSNPEVGDAYCQGPPPRHPLGSAASRGSGRVRSSPVQRVSGWISRLGRRTGMRGTEEWLGCRGGGYRSPVLPSLIRQASEACMPRVSRREYVVFRRTARKKSLGSRLHTPLRNMRDGLLRVQQRECRPPEGVLSGHGLPSPEIGPGRRPKGLRPAKEGSRLRARGVLAVLEG